ncbi:MAG: hypothetical protein KA327_03740 [Pseudarcicella sp.]|nr:hypothetical protein [Pseudarcicella sp.]
MKFIFFKTKRWLNKTKGTIIAAKKVKGNSNIATLGCSNAKTWKGDFADNIAKVTIMKSKIIHAKFQIFRKLKLIFGIKNNNNNADIPDNMSKLYPSKVIRSGTFLSK